MNGIRYKINAPSVVAEVIDGEAVIVNMENGSYYSIDDSGAFVWDLIAQGARFDDIVATAERHYASSEVDIASHVAALISEFIKEDLVAQREEADSGPARIYPTTPVDWGFRPPQLKKYTDMEELLLLDPIHEEDAADEDTRAAG